MCADPRAQAPRASHRTQEGRRGREGPAPTLHSESTSLSFWPNSLSDGLAPARLAQLDLGWADC